MTCIPFFSVRVGAVGAPMKPDLSSVKADQCAAERTGTDLLASTGSGWPEG